MPLNRVAATPAPTIAFDPHRLDVYALALAFQAQVGALIPARGHAYLRDQLLRASVSIVLNVAEGAGRFSRPDKARFYGMARGSACECAALLDLIEGAISSRAECDAARNVLARIVAMLTRLIARMKAR